MIAARIEYKLNVKPAGEKEELLISSIGVLLCDDRYEHVYDIQRDIKAVYNSVFAEGQTGIQIFDHDTIREPRGPLPKPRGR